MRPDETSGNHEQSKDCPPSRVHMNTTIEPSKLAILRKHAQRLRKSLGELVDEYVDLHYPPPEGPSRTP